MTQLSCDCIIGLCPCRLLLNSHRGTTGWKISPETVRRIRKEPPLTNTEIPAVKTPTARSVKACYPGHVWMTDLTDVAGLFGLFRFKIAVILDVFSRLPLAFSIFTKEPTAQDIRILFLKAMTRFGIPRHFVSDKGSQFIDSGFRQFLFGLGVRHRFGAIGKTGSIAIIERFWKQLKFTLSLRSFRPLFQEDLEQRLESGLFYYTNIRHHQGLSGATPAEVFSDKNRPVTRPSIHPVENPEKDLSRYPSTLGFSIPKECFPFSFLKLRRLKPASSLKLRRDVCLAGNHACYLAHF